MDDELNNLFKHNKGFRKGFNEYVEAKYKGGFGDKTLREVCQEFYDWANSITVLEMYLQS